MHRYNLYKESLKAGDRIADRVTNWTGAFSTFCFAALVIVIWACLGPYFNYSDTWQLVINTGTTIITFLMVFLIQNNQNRQSERDRLHAEEDYQTNLDSKREIEALQIFIKRIEVEKLDAIRDRGHEIDDKLDIIIGRLEKLERDTKY